MTRVGAEATAKRLKLSPTMRKHLCWALVHSKHSPHAYHPRHISVYRALIKRELAIGAGGECIRLTPTGRELAAGLAGEGKEGEA